MVATACVEQMCVLNGCMLCHGAELSAIVRGCPVWVGPHVVHPFTHSVITIHEFSCSCIRCSSCTHLLTLVCIQSCNFISCHTTSCHAMFNSAPLGSLIHLLHTRTTTHTLLNDTHLTRATLGANFAGRDAIVCMQRLLKRTGFWTAPIVRIDLLAAPMPAAGGKTAANQADRANIVPKLGGSRVASHAC